MERIEWSEECSIGVGLFDFQHQHLIKLTNELIDEFDSGGHSSRISALMQDLHQHTLAHFDYEERFMLHYGYPDYEEHRQKHREFLSEIEAVGASVIADGYHVTEEQAHLLAEWFIYHIKDDDMAYKSFFKDAGLL